MNWMRRRKQQLRNTKKILESNMQLNSTSGRKRLCLRVEITKWDTHLQKRSYRGSSLRKRRQRYVPDSRKWTRSYFLLNLSGITRERDWQGDSQRKTRRKDWNKLWITMRKQKYTNKQILNQSTRQSFSGQFILRKTLLKSISLPFLKKKMIMGLLKRIRQSKRTLTWKTWSRRTRFQRR